MTEPIARIYRTPVPYAQGLKLQEEAVERCKEEGLPRLLVLEHPHTITKGKNFDPAHAKLSEYELLRKGIEVHNADRIGSITYHGPGQLVAYPILDLNHLNPTDKGIKKYITLLEDITISFLGMYGLQCKGSKDIGHAGVWYKKNGNERKIASIGISVEHGKNGMRITKHGIAINIGTDLSYFNFIHQCGSSSAIMTSVEQVLGYKVPMKGAMLNFIDRFSTTSKIKFKLEECINEETVSA